MHELRYHWNDFFGKSSSICVFDHTVGTGQWGWSSSAVSGHSTTIVCWESDSGLTPHCVLYSIAASHCSQPTSWCQVSVVQAVWLELYYSGSYHILCEELAVSMLNGAFTVWQTKGETCEWNKCLLEWLTGNVLTLPDLILACVKWSGYKVFFTHLYFAGLFLLQYFT